MDAKVKCTPSIFVFILQEDHNGNKLCAFCVILGTFYIVCMLLFLYCVLLPNKQIQKIQRHSNVSFDKYPHHCLLILSPFWHEAPNDNRTNNRRMTVNSKLTFFHCTYRRTYQFMRRKYAILVDIIE